MITGPSTLTEFRPAIRQRGMLIICLALCTLELGLSARAQEPARAPNIKEVVQPNFVNSPHRAYPTGGAIRASARAQVATPAVDAKEVVLHNFVSPPHGAYPGAGVIRDPEGNLYGTTNGAYSDVPGGGAHNAGVVFKVDTCGHETVLYSFTGGADGSSPNGVILDWAANLYGTTNGGGASGAGVVFKVDPSGHETVLYSFTGGNDGGFSDAGVIRDWKGNLYGTTNGGGASSLGVAFKVDTSGKETVLHTFTRGLEGDQPYLSGLILDSFGNLYGTTAFGGAGGAGVVYKLDPSGNDKVVYAFQGAAGGQYPAGAGVIYGSDGNLYG